MVVVEDGIVSRHRYVSHVRDRTRGAHRTVHIGMDAVLDVVFVRAVVRLVQSVIHVRCIRVESGAAVVESRLALGVVETEATSWNAAGIASCVESV
jgi:hypothetical protein